jgi:hypothetical protein
MSVPFKTLLMELWQKGFSNFALSYPRFAMDSIFLGVLAGFGLKMHQQADNSPQRLVELESQRPDHRVAG